jgi:hypothetical protein
VNWLASGLVAGAMMFGQGNQLIVLQKPVVANGLAGVVVDSTGSSVSGAEVQLISCSDFGKLPTGSLSMVKADGNGRFRLQPKVHDKLYCLQFVSLGFDLLQIRVKLSPRASALRPKLTPGT